MSAASENQWRDGGVRIVHGDQLDSNTPQTPGMTRAAAINRVMAGANRLWAGTVSVHPNAKTAPHHHGELESIIYIVSGRGPDALGRSDFSFSRRPARGILSSCRRSSRIRKSMPVPASR